MGTSKNTEKKALDALKEQLQPLSGNEQGALAGGFSSDAAEAIDAESELNIGCPENSKCNVVAGCGGTTTPTTPPTSS